MCNSIIYIYILIYTCIFDFLSKTTTKKTTKKQLEPPPQGIITSARLCDTRRPTPSRSRPAPRCRKLAEREPDRVATHAKHASATTSAFGKIDGPGRKPSERVPSSSNQTILKNTYIGSITARSREASLPSSALGAMPPGGMREIAVNLHTLFQTYPSRKVCRHRHLFVLTKKFLSSHTIGHTIHFCLSLWHRILPTKSLTVMLLYLTCFKFLGQVLEQICSQRRQCCNHRPSRSHAWCRPQAEPRPSQLPRSPAQCPPPGVARVSQGLPVAMPAVALAPSRASVRPFG